MDRASGAMLLPVDSWRVAAAPPPHRLVLRRIGTSNPPTAPQKLHAGLWGSFFFSSQRLHLKFFFSQRLQGLFFFSQRLQGLLFLTETAGTLSSSLSSSFSHRDCRDSFFFFFLVETACSSVGLFISFHCRLILFPRTPF